MQNIIYCVSDHTGITVEGLAKSLLSQFKGMIFEYHTVPYVDTEEQGLGLIAKLETLSQQPEYRVIVFSSIVNKRLRRAFTYKHFQHFDLFNAFLPNLEMVLEEKASAETGLSHGVLNQDKYMTRIEAINYALMHDDGLSPKNYDKADIVLVGVSRSGKTPTCLYMAIQFGVYAANYPMTEESLSLHALPKTLQPVRNKLFGLLIEPSRLAQIRAERLPNSQYASLAQCQQELNQVERLFQEEGVSYLNTTQLSIEEISTKILAASGIEKRFY